MKKFLIIFITLINTQASLVKIEKHKNFNINVEKNKRSKELENYLNKKYYNKRKKDSKNISISYKISKTNPFVQVHLTITINDKKIHSIFRYDEYNEKKINNIIVSDWEIDFYFIQKLAQHINKELQKRA